MVHTSLFHVAVLGLSVAVATTLAIYAFGARQVPGRLLFSLFMLSVSVWAGAYGVGLLTRGRNVRVALEATAWIGRATIPVWIFLFALAYTGYDRLVTRRTVVGLLLFPAVLVLAVWAHPWNDLVWATEPRLVFFDGLALVVADVGPLYWASVVFAYVLILLTAVLLIRLVILSEHLYLNQSAMLLVGLVAPVLANAFTVFPPYPVPGFDYTPYGFVITGIAFGYSLFRRRLFELVPATHQLGRDDAIRQLDDGVLIVDTNTQILYCNPAAAAMLGCEPKAAIGNPAGSFVDECALDFETRNALAEWQRDDTVYEVRTSPIRDRRERLIGHTLLIRDITARKRREQRLTRQRDELERLDDLNTLIRGVIGALVSASDRAEIEQAVCERLADSELFEMAIAADVPTWNGTADRWTVAGSGVSEETLPADLDTTGLDLTSESDGSVSSEEIEDRGGWIVIPLLYERTVYGALGLYARRDPTTDGGTIRDRERSVLAELGELVGHSINATENRRLLAADAIVELELQSRDISDPLVAVTDETDARVTVTGLVPNGDASHLAYARIENGASTAVVERLQGAEDAIADTDVVRTEEADGMLQWSVPDESLLKTLMDQGTNVLEATAAHGVFECTVEVASGTDARTLVERVQESFPDTELLARRERERPVDRADSLPEDGIEELTESQEEALEVAYRSGYFDWPRENTAEEVADTLDISSPTFHYHLRRAESALVESLLGDDREE